MKKVVAAKSKKGTPRPSRDWRALGRKWVRRTGAVAVLLLLLAGLAMWWAARWTPPRSDYPLQGVTINAANGNVHWGSVKAAGADFAYLMATDGDKRADPKFVRNEDAAGAMGIRTGAIHRFNLCQFASDQAANFIRHVPRRRDSLPPAVWLDLDDSCSERPTRALVLSELATFLAQIEAHLGKSSIIAPSAAFESRYHVASGIARTTWLRRDFFAPSYGEHPWAMWQANDYIRLSGVDGTVGWNVVQSQGEVP